MTEESSCGSRQPMGIFWDMKSCPIPAGVNHADLADNIIAALRDYLPDYYPKVFFVCGDLPSPLLSRWERDGLKIHNVVGDRGDYDMLTHMIDLSFDHPAAGMFLISREWDHLSHLARLSALGHRSVIIYAFNEPFPGVDLFEYVVSCLDWRCVANGSSQSSSFGV